MPLESINPLVPTFSNLFPAATGVKWGLRSLRVNPAFLAQTGLTVGFIALVISVYEISRRCLGEYIEHHFSSHPRWNHSFHIMLFTTVQTIGSGLVAMVGYSFYQAWMLIGVVGIAKFIKNKKENKVKKEPLHMAQPNAQLKNKPLIVEEEDTITPEGPEPFLRKMIGEVELKSLPKAKKTPPIKVSPVTNVTGFNVGGATSIGKRRTNEDVHGYGFVELDDQSKVPYFIVLDGHGGSFVSHYMRGRFKEMLQGVLTETLQKVSDLSTPEAFTVLKANLKESFENLNLGLKKKYHIQSMNTGSTALLAFIHKNFLYVANAGDSRAVISKDLIAENLSLDAKPDREPFLSSIKKRTGEVIVDKFGIARVDGVSVARAFGDFNCVGICCNPKVTRFDLTTLNPANKNFFIIACDGIWDVMSSQKAVDLVAMHSLSQNQSPAEASSLLVRTAITMGSTDNCTVMIIDLSSD